MFTARATLDDDSTLLVLGLSKENRKRLDAGQPIRISRETHGMAVPKDLKVLIFVGETEASMRAAMEGLIGPLTVIDQRREQ